MDKCCVALFKIKYQTIKLFRKRKKKEKLLNRDDLKEFCEYFAQQKKVYIIIIGSRAAGDGHWAIEMN